MKKLLGIIVLCLFLANCANYIAEKERINLQKENAALDKQRQEDKDTCKYYGFKANTPEFSDCLMNLDIRLGRTEKQKLELVKTFIVGVEKFFGVNKNNQYVTLTNHQGNEFNFYEKSLSDWIKNDDPNKDL